jgi:hypothetical protein
VPPQQSQELACRICLSGDEPGNPLVRKCACRGTSAWVHDTCLSQWRRTSDNPQDAYRCGLCHDYYRDALSLELLATRLREQSVVRGDDHEATLITMHERAKQMQEQGSSDSVTLFTHVLMERRSRLGNMHALTLESINSLGNCLADICDRSTPDAEASQVMLAATESLLREGLEGCRATLGDEHANTLASITNLGNLLRNKGDMVAAEPLLREAVETSRVTLGFRHYATLGAINNLAGMHHEQGDQVTAEGLYREALSGYRATLGDRHPTTLLVLQNLLILRRLGAV